MFDKTTILIVCWVLFGQIGFALALRKSGKLSINDIIVSILAGILGPLAILYIIQSYTRSDFWTKGRF